MESNEIRNRFLKFFEERGHKIIPSASLIPENDPSVLFTTAGMHPLVPYLLGQKHSLGNKLTNVQKCIRTGDIDEVGDYCHHTFFEMMGNWSLGDYFKEEAIKLSYEFLTSKKYLGLDKERLAVSIFAGDEDAPPDEKAFTTWKNLGINEKRIAKLPKKNNWWGPAGETGPCGPDTEMFYWVGNINDIPESFNDDNPLWMEIWNDVFMEYNKNKDGRFEQLTQKNIDTGMGLERVLAVMNGFDDNYRTELFWPIIEETEKLSGKKYPEEVKAMRIIADHLKASTFILGDERGVVPANSGQGYVLRRLIRRAVRYGKQLGLSSFTPLLANVVIEMYKNVYPELLLNKNFILENIAKEEEKFEKTLERGLREFEKKKQKFENNISEFTLTGEELFDLYSTYGFPVEISLEELDKVRMSKIPQNIKDFFINSFKEKMEAHQKLSQTSSAGMFKGGLSDAGEESTKLHTATHLLNAALKEIVNPNVAQKGSNITAERLRFDFACDHKLTEEEKQKVEDWVNDKIKRNLNIIRKEMSLAEAVKIGAQMEFGSKYPEIVSVYFAEDENGQIYSKEFCGGPHVANTRELGHFKIQKEEAVASGIRRIKAILN